MAMAAGGGQQNQNPAPSSTTHQQSPTRPSQSSHDADQTSLADGGGDGKAAISESDTSPSTSDAPNTNGPFVAVHSNSFRNPFKAIMQTRNSKKAAVNEPYQVNFPAPDTTYRKKSNYIRTTKYTLLTFLPLTLFYQFHRFYNIYFLVGALTTIAGVSSLSPFSQIAPLCFVLIVSMAKEAWEDWHRYKADRKANMDDITVLRKGQKVKATRMYVQPGDIIYLEKGEKCPVDAVILSTSYEDGTCFVETSELDGETNLKRRSAVGQLAHINTDDQIARLQGIIQCEQPNDKLNTFDGLLTLSPYPSSPNPSRLPLTPINVILRGSTLRNTTHAYCIVVYTGQNTKIIRNLKKPKLKTSTLERQLNWLVCGAFVYNAVLLISSVWLEWRWYYRVRDREQVRKATNPNDYAVYWYIGPMNDSPATHVVFTFISYFGLYTYVIPISLFVTIEIVRLIQGRFIHWDASLRSYITDSDGETKVVKAKANNTNLNEDLGCVEYVFSDKTGTVTRNDMRVVGWYIDGVGTVDVGQGKVARGGEVGEKFGLSLALCHGVIPAPDPRREGELLYESQSPDETALLQAIKNEGYVLLSRSKSTTTVAKPNEERPIAYQQLVALDFTSDRKRMSVVIRMPDGRIMLFCKGADNIVLGRLRTTEKATLDAVNAALKHYAEQGLRTLVVAYKELSETEWENFRVHYEEAERSLVDREARIAEACEMVETNLIFLGCSAIEDRLQDEVPETIEFLVESGIKVWLLTGDKMETAINIGMSSRLILPDMNVLILDAPNEAELKGQLETFTTRLAHTTHRTALVIPGSTLHDIFDSKHTHLPPLLLSLATKCSTVIACRVTPLQKAMVVSLVQKSLNVTTLAIGDGANDVSMIMGASIGVGVQGREGTQAVRAADYSIGEFRALKPLLAVHGRWSRGRLGTLVFYSFYKNLVCITIQWWFGFMCAWSGQLVYEEIFLTAFNIAFTSLPPLILAIFDYDAKRDILYVNPQMYAPIRQGLYWSWKHIASTAVSFIWGASIIFGCVWFAFWDEVLDPNGWTTGYWVQAYVFSTPMLLVVLGKAGLMSKVWVGKWFWITGGVLLLSLLFNLIIMGVVEAAKFVENGTFEAVHVLPGYWVVGFLIVATALGGEWIAKFFYHHIYPTDADILLEEQKMNTTADGWWGRRWRRKKEKVEGDRVEMGEAG